MNYLKQFGVDKPSVINLMSTANQGKSTLLAMFIKEFGEIDGDILLLTDENPKIWSRRLINSSLERKNENKLIIRKVKFGTHVFSIVKSYEDLNLNLKCVVIDMVLSYDQKNDLVELINYSKENNFWVFFTTQTNKLGFKNDETLPFEVGREFLHKSDLCLSINKKSLRKKPWYIRIFETFLNLFKSSNVENNVILTIHKNRFGPEGKLDTYLDFNKINGQHESSSDR